MLVSIKMVQGYWKQGAPHLFPPSSLVRFTFLPASQSCSCVILLHWNSTQFMGPAVIKWSRRTPPTPLARNITHVVLVYAIYSAKGKQGLSASCVAECESADYHQRGGGALVVDRRRKIGWCLCRGDHVFFLQIGRQSSRQNGSRALQGGRC